MTVDIAAAMAWYQKAADKGEARAQVALAFLALTGTGRPADPHEAGRLFVLASEQGEPRGLYNAGLLHLAGERIA